jgi:hypothetical protein
LSSSVFVLKIPRHCKINSWQKISKCMWCIWSEWQYHPSFHYKKQLNRPLLKINFQSKKNEILLRFSAKASVQSVWNCPKIIESPTKVISWYRKFTRFEG